MFLNPTPIHFKSAEYSDNEVPSLRTTQDHPPIQEDEIEITLKWAYLKEYLKVQYAFKNSMIHEWCNSQ